MKRKAVDGDQPTKYLASEAVSGMVHEAEQSWDPHYPPVTKTPGSGLQPLILSTLVTCGINTMPSCSRILVAPTLQEAGTEYSTLGCP